MIPRFHDERDEKAMSFFAGLAVNTLFEQLSGELLQARYENARFKSIRTACQLILRDEARHIQFGRIIMRRFFAELSADDRRLLGEKVAKKLRGSLLNGVYAVVNLPDDERERAGRNRALAAEHGLGATHPDQEIAIIRRALDQIREDVAPYGVEIPEVPEVDRAGAVAHCSSRTRRRIRHHCRRKHESIHRLAERPAAAAVALAASPPQPRTPTRATRNPGGPLPAGRIGRHPRRTVGAEARSSGWASPWWWTTAAAREPRSEPRSWRARRPTATRCCSARSARRPSIRR